MATSASATHRACDACGAAVSKYTCPACGRKTCSVVCINRHKVEHECDGKRARVAFIDIRDFTDGDIVRDYIFLEDAGATEERAKRWKPTFGEVGGGAERDGGEGARASGGGGGRGRGGRGRGRGRGIDVHHARRALDALGAKCAERGVEVRFMANGMARRRLNTTTHHRKRDEVFWRCEWVFHVGDARVVRADDKVSENLTLADVYAAHVKALTIETEDKASVAAFKPPVVADDADDDTATPSYVALLEQFDTPANAKRWHAVSLEQTLGESLRGKVVVEFPTFHVVARAHAEAYVLAS